MVSACGVDDVSVTGVGNMPGVGMGVDNDVDFYVECVIIIHCLLELADDDDFHLCFSGIVTVVVAVATYSENYSGIVSKHLLKKKGVLLTSQGYQ